MEQVWQLGIVQRIHCPIKLGRKLEFEQVWQILLDEHTAQFASQNKQALPAL